MEVTYIKLFVDYLDAIEPLGDAERGRLFTALLEYVKTGETSRLSGNERFLFPMMRAQIDRDISAMDEISEKRSQSGKMGGRPKKQEEAKKAKAFLESKKSKEEDKEEYKDNLIKENIKRKAASRFSPPTYEEAEEYRLEKGLNMDSAYFVDYYTSNGWRVNNQSMEDWKTADFYPDSGVAAAGNF